MQCAEAVNFKVALTAVLHQLSFGFQVNEATELLSSYNERLQQELVDRRRYHRLGYQF
jgi:hypothetical protein